VKNPGTSIGTVSELNQKLYRRIEMQLSRFSLTDG